MVLRGVRVRKKRGAREAGWFRPSFVVPLNHLPFPSRTVENRHVSSGSATLCVVGRSAKASPPPSFREINQFRDNQFRKPSTLGLLILYDPGASTVPPQTTLQRACCPREHMLLCRLFVPHASLFSAKALSARPVYFSYMYTWGRHRHGT